jgi:parvulin-like peptidyl-prolyl isomerase
MYIYSHFRHVSGVPAPEGAQGVSISKLKILDALIERLSQIKKQSNTNPVQGQNISDERIDALIDQYEQQIRASQGSSYQAGAAGTTASYMPQASTGAILNLVA